MVGLGLLVGLAIAVMLFAKALVLPIVTLETSAVLALMAAVAYRFMVDRQGQTPSYAATSHSILLPRSLRK